MKTSQLSVKKSKVGKNSFSSNHNHFSSLNPQTQIPIPKETYMTEKRSYSSLKYKSPPMKQSSSFSKENVDFRVVEERENYYCNQLDKLQKKLISVSKKKKRLEKENEKVHKKYKNLKIDLEKNKKYLKLMKDEMDNFHEENRYLMEDKRQLEDIVSRVSRASNWRSRDVSRYSSGHRRESYSPIGRNYNF